MNVEIGKNLILQVNLDNNKVKIPHPGVTFVSEQQ